jgi:hypothetical protein
METTPETTAPETPTKKLHANCGRKPSEAQMAVLRRGMDAIKAKRVAIAAAKEAGNYDPKDFAPKPKVVTLPKSKQPGYKKADPDTGLVRETVFVPRAPRVRQTATRDEIAELKKSIEGLINEKVAAPPPVVTERVVEVPVERIVEKEVIRDRVVTGRELLDKVFFSK